MLQHVVMDLFTAYIYICIFTFNLTFNHQYLKLNVGINIISLGLKHNVCVYLCILQFVCKL